MPKLVLSTLFALMTAAVAHAADQVVGNCSNETELRADLTAMQASGGTLTFSCTTSTIVVTSVLPSIAQNVKINGGGDVTISGGNSSRIFTVNGGAALELENIVLTNASSSEDGGAIYSNGSVTLRDVEVKNSVAGLSGGGIVTYGPLTVEDSTFSGNRAANGAAIYARFSNAVVNIHDSVLHHNETTDKVNGWGGAILLWDGATVTIEGSRVYDNRAALGGAVNNQFANSSVTIRDSLFERNVAGFDVQEGLGDGGALYIRSGPLHVETTVFLENVADLFGGAVLTRENLVTVEDSMLRGGNATDGGGILCGPGCQLTMRRSTIYDNDAAFGAGAVVSESATATFENVTFGSNAAFYSGGALYVSSTGVTLSNSTVHQNSAGTGDIFVNNNAVVSMRNTIVSGSTGSNCSHIPGGIVSLDGNLSDDNSCAAGLTALHDLNGPSYDPLLVLAETSASIVYVPQPGSPAVDGGIAAGAPSHDQRGVARPQAAAHDKGSVEIADCDDVVCGDANGDGSVAAADALLALRTAVGSGACPVWRCDFNGDESVAASDALAILRTAVGQSIPSDCPDAWDCAG
jgi:predicted outer membrane repeat protein